MPKGKRTNKKPIPKDNNKLIVEETSNYDLINLKNQIEALKAENEKLRQIQQPKIMQSYNNVQVSNKSTHNTTNSLLNSVNTNKDSHKQHKKKLAVISSDSDDSNYYNKRLPKKRKSQEVISSDNYSDSETNRSSNNESSKQIHHIALSDSESEINKIKPLKNFSIAKPPNLKWYKLSEILSLDSKVYISYRSAMREFVAQLWAHDTPEYRKLSATKKRTLIKKYKANNPDFPNCINDWAIKMMMRRSINQQHSQSDAEDSNQYDHSESSTMVNTEGQILSTLSLSQEPTNIAPKTPEDTNLNKKQASKNKRITSMKVKQTSVKPSRVLRPTTRFQNKTN
ncbi:2213_t:CDS:2 [Gigaspora rosea]|nr:2213_t:CDS:2 [Gigaspora rosea]